MKLVAHCLQTHHCLTHHCAPPSLWESGVKESNSHRRQWHRNQSQSRSDVWDPGCGLLPAWDELDSPVNQRTLKCQHSYPTQLMGKLTPEEIDLTFTGLSSESHAKNKMKHCVPGHCSLFQVPPTIANTDWCPEREAKRQSPIYFF